MECLRTLGCDFVQGPLLAPALPAASIPKYLWLSRRRSPDLRAVNSSSPLVFFYGAMITAHAIRSPALPVGSVIISSAFA